MTTPAENYIGIMVTLKVEGEHSLFVMLGADGAIKRMGNGAVDNDEFDMFIGKTGPELFASILPKITPEFCQWFGQSLGDRESKGKMCELTVGVMLEGGEEKIMQWRYGAESQGPPPEVCQFVIAVVDTTEPWFVQQKAMAEKTDQ